MKFHSFLPIQRETKNTNKHKMNELMKELMKET